MKSLILLAATAFISLNAWALHPPLTLDSITPVAGSEDLLVQYSSLSGAKYVFRDDDGMATIASLNRMITWERGVQLGDKSWDQLKAEKSSMYSVARPLFIQQLRRLSKNLKVWAKAESDNEQAAKYSMEAERADSWAATFAEKADQTNEEMNTFNDFIIQVVGNHGYQVSKDGGEFEAGNQIIGAGNEVAEHNQDTDSRCAAATNGDFEALVRGALNGGTLEKILNEAGGAK